MYKLSLAHLYPKSLNLYGDNGNVLALKRRCEWRGIELSVVEIELGDNINLLDFDMFFLGAGLEEQQKLVANDLQLKKNALKEAMAQNAVIMGVCSGYQLLGEYYETDNNEKIDGLGLLDIYTIKTETRAIGNVTVSCGFLEPQTLVGFENHSGETYIKGETRALARVEVGFGNNGKDKTEGARKRNVFGSYLHGALFPKNPHFADYLIELALEKKYNEKIKLQKLNDEIELSTHKELVGKKY